MNTLLSEDQRLFQRTVREFVDKKHIAQNEYIFPPTPSLRLVVDTLFPAEGLELPSLWEAINGGRCRSCSERASCSRSR